MRRRICARLTPESPERVLRTSPGANRTYAAFDATPLFVRTDRQVAHRISWREGKLDAYETNLRFSFGRGVYIA